MKRIELWLRKIKLGFIFAILVTFTFTTSCGDAKKPAIGQEDEIIVFADSLEFYELENSLLTVFGKIIYTPQPENLFFLTRKNINEIDKYKNRKNLILISPINSITDAGEYINAMLNKDVKKLIEDDSVTVVNKRDLWANNQLVMILSSGSMDKLKKNIINQHENLLHYFQKISNERLYSSLYNERYEQKDIEAKFLNEYGWILYVQSDFYLSINNSKEKFVWLRRSPGTDMERWIFVHWIDNASPEMLNSDTLYSIRNKLTQKYFRTSNDSNYVEIIDDYKSTTEVNFLNRYALMTQGLWRMNDGSMGGPFVNYTFYDQPTKRIYMLDGSIYAPKYYKKKLIQQVDVILQSFLTEREISPDRKENILEEL